MQRAWTDRYRNLHDNYFTLVDLLVSDCGFNLETLSIPQKEYCLARPAREAEAKAKMEAEALLTADTPLHADNEWNIRYSSSTMTHLAAKTCNFIAPFSLSLLIRSG